MIIGVYIVELWWMSLVIRTVVFRPTGRCAQSADCAASLQIMPSSCAIWRSVQCTIMWTPQTAHQMMRFSCGLRKRHARRVQKNSNLCEVVNCKLPDRVIETEKTGASPISVFANEMEGWKGSTGTQLIRCTKTRIVLVGCKNVLEKIHQIVQPIYRFAVWLRKLPIDRLCKSPDCAI